MKAIVVGGGIVGLSTAFYLNQTGWSVTVIDKTDISDNSSFKNMGMVAPSHLFTKSTYGLLSTPDLVRPQISFSFSLLSWYLKYFQFSNNHNNRNHDDSSLLELTQLSKSLFQYLSYSTPYPYPFENKGIIVYYKSFLGQSTALHRAELAYSKGMQIGVLTKDDVQKLEPGFQFNITGAFQFKSDAIVSPEKVMEALCVKLVRSGVTFRLDTAVENIRIENNRAQSVITEKEELAADIVILAGGSGLSGLAKMAGLYLPVLPCKGYSFTEKNPEANLKHPAILAETGVCINSMDGNMRYGNMHYPGHFCNKLNIKKVEEIVRSVNNYIPGLKVKMPALKNIWTGFSPCTPDGLPYIGYSPKIKNLLVAGGHGISGFGMGPATGMIMAELANGGQTSVNIKSFDPARFM